MDISTPKVLKPLPMKALRDFSSASEKRWYREAAVRRAEVFPESSETGPDEICSYFPVEAIHPSFPSWLKTMPLVSVLHFELLQLYRHLKFTTLLELRLVLPTLQDIALGELGVRLSEDLRLQASRLITDEAFHGQRSEELIAHLEQTSGIKCPADNQLKPYLEAIHQPSSLEGKLRRFFFCFVSETIITAIIAKNARSVKHPGSRGFFQEHLKDEMTHSVFFRQAFQEIWSQLNEAQKAQAQKNFASDIEFFIKPNWTDALTDLESIGLSDLANQIRECLNTDEAIAAYRWWESAAVTLKSLQNHKIELNAVGFNLAPAAV